MVERIPDSELWAVRNALRHASASTLAVTVRGDGRVLVLEVVDDGVGFDPATDAVDPHSFGLRGLRSLVREAGGTLEVSVDVTNTGKRKGDDVVQLYARYEKSAVKRPQKQLVGFRRVRLAPGETKTVTLTFDPSEIAYWDVPKHAFVVEPGKVELQIARSARDVVLTAAVNLG